MKRPKFIFVSGGVLSGLGKGIVTASIGNLLKSRGYKVTAVKIDMYLNLDAGTIRPTEHGEVFVTKDGLETDQDIGNYERFLEQELNKTNYITTGQVYWEVLRKERAFEYDGEDVEAIPHVSNEIIRRIELAGSENKSEIVLVELGGTVGEYQNALFFEATRLMKMKYPNDVLQVHLAYLPIPSKLGEMKTKPVQQSVQALNSMGIQPDFIIGRSEIEMDEKRKERIALFCNVSTEHIFSDPDVESIYEIPKVLDEQCLAEKMLSKLGLAPRYKHGSNWKKLIKKIKKTKKNINIALVGKYFQTGDFVLSDAYISVIEAIKHAGWDNGVGINLKWINAQDFEKNPNLVEKLNNYHGIVVPGGFGSRGIEGIISAIKFAREIKIPYLGLCYGMQLATVEFARNVAGIKDANTAEINPKGKNNVIHIMTNQEKKMLKNEYGGSMRLGNYLAKINRETISYQAYRKSMIEERHRHRYEFNNKYRKHLEKFGLVIAGTSPDNHIVEIIELKKKDHPFFVGVQFHPEFKSWPTKGHPLFKEFMRSIKY
jgi:CTP synthase